MRSGCLAVATLLTLACATPGDGAAASHPVVRVPFVGCRSDGQVGPLRAPAGHRVAADVSPALAERLAFYKAEDGWGVLAPRGWHCFATYGSAGVNLYVTPESIDSASLFTDRWRGFSGQVIQITYEYGGTSGRFGVADIIARVFPAYMSFARDVAAENASVGAPALSLHVGPYPQDKLRYLNNHAVEFETPAHEKGLGTFSDLQSNADPIMGFAALVGDETDLVFVDMRLPASDHDLIRPILEQVERRASRMPPG